MNRRVSTDTVVAIFGTLGILFTFWLPWTFLNAKLVIEKSGIDFPRSNNPGANQAIKDLMGVFSQIQTGNTGVVNLGFLVPSWIFVLFVFFAGVITVLASTERIFVGRQALVILILLPTAVLGIWIWQQMSEGAAIQAGPHIAVVSVGLILFSAIKTKPADKSST